MIASANEIIELPMESFEFDVGIYYTYVNHWGGGGKTYYFLNEREIDWKAKKNRLQHV